MKTSTLIPLLLSASTTTALTLPRNDNPTGPNRTWKYCSTPDASFMEFAASLDASSSNNPILSSRETVQIDTWIHVIAGSEKEEDGYVSEESIKKQIAVINDAFDKRNIHFKHAGTTRTVNPDMAVINEGEATSKLGEKMRKGGYDTLNLYIVKDMPGNVAGDCTFPVPNASGTFAADGCRFNWDTLPPKSNGRVVIHEIGHWLGLLHTFQEGVDNPTCTTGHGDDIADTPVHLRPDGVRCEEMDTCPGMEGKDPIHNYMNYTPTSCWTHFTDLQAERMHGMVKVRRDAK